MVTLTALGLVHLVEEARRGPLGVGLVQAVHLNTLRQFWTPCEITLVYVSFSGWSRLQPMGLVHPVAHQLDQPTLGLVAHAGCLDTLPTYRYGLSARQEGCPTETVWRLLLESSRKCRPPFRLLVGGAAVSLARPYLQPRETAACCWCCCCLLLPSLVAAGAACCCWWCLFVGTSASFRDRISTQQRLLL